MIHEFWKQLARMGRSDAAALEAGTVFSQRAWALLRRGLMAQWQLRARRDHVTGTRRRRLDHRNVGDEVDNCLFALEDADDMRGHAGRVAAGESDHLLDPRL